MSGGPGFGNSGAFNTKSCADPNPHSESDYAQRAAYQPHQQDQMNTNSGPDLSHMSCSSSSSVSSSGANAGTLSSNSSCHSSGWQRARAKYPRVQIITAERASSGKKPLDPADRHWRGVRARDAGDDPVIIPLELSGRWRRPCRLSSVGPNHSQPSGGPSLIASRYDTTQRSAHASRTSTRPLPSCA
jgi:hypothetical protein